MTIVNLNNKWRVTIDHLNHTLEHWVVQWLNEADRKMRVRFKIKDTGDLESKRAEAVAFREEVQRALVLNQGYTITHGD